MTTQPTPVSLAVILPTRNELKNLETLIDEIIRHIETFDYEIIVVDDNSNDNTYQHMIDRHKINPRIRILVRLHERGLSSACIQGMLSSSKDYFIVMDADFQHNPAQIPELVQTLINSDADIVSASRFLNSPQCDGLTFKRQILSRASNYISSKIFKLSQTDPMTGFFIIRRSFFYRHAPSLSGLGFKILLDIVLSAGSEVNLREIPFQFGRRLHGESKLDTHVFVDAICLVLEKLIGHIIPITFLMFVSVGLLGLVLHTVLLFILHLKFNFPFWSAQLLCAFGAMTLNFWLNNVFTYKDRKLKGNHFLKGIVSFYAICFLGLYINMQTALYLYDHQLYWWLCGGLGAILGAFWNYCVSATFTWKLHSRK